MTAYRDVALHFDGADVPVEAAWAYELALRDDSSTLEDHLNLAVLYFTCLDFGYAATHRLAMPFVNAAHNRCREVLDLAELRFGTRGEILFWRRYFDVAELGEVEPPETWLKLAQLGDTDLPFVYLAVFVDKAKYGERAARAVDRLRDRNTARARLLRSLMSSRAA